METVIEKWSRDIEGIESEIKGIESNIADMIKTFDAYANQFHMRVNIMKDAIAETSKAFEAFANQARAEAKAMRVEANAMNAHIWGTQEAKEAWQKKYGR